MNGKAFFAALMLAVLWCGSPAPAFAVTGKPSVVTFVDAANQRQIYAFVQDDNNGHLLLNRFDGTSWSWVDHGAPPGATRINSPTAITYVDSSGNQRIYVFALTGAGGSGRLVIRFWNGFQWQWVDHGSPPFDGGGHSLQEGTLSATTYVDDEGNRRIYVFGLRNWPDAYPKVKERLTARHWNGSSWQWEDHGVDSDANCRHSFTQTINYRDFNGNRRVEVFCTSQNLYLFKRRLALGSWSWIAQGGDQILTERGSALTFENASGGPEVHVFVVRQAPYRDLIQNFGSSWTPLGSTPAETSGPSAISAIAWADGAGTRRMQVFTENHRRLYSRSWTGSGWTSWVDRGLPAPEPQGLLEDEDAIAAITFLDGPSGKQKFYVFATGIYNNMYLYYWDGSAWKWQDNGKP